jgi:TetR/AcrR family transcriptional repressor of nem operon
MSYAVFIARATKPGSVAMSIDSAVPLTPRGRAVYERIVDVAADLIYCQGLSNTSVNAVREAAAVSGSQMTHYFIDKRALVRSVIARRQNDLISLHTGGALEKLDSFQALQDWADLNVQAMIDRDCIGGCVFGSLVSAVLPSDDDEIRRDVTAVYDEWTALLRTALTAMRSRGELRADADPRHLARVLIAAHQGGSLLAQTMQSPKPLRDAVNAAVDYVCSFSTEPVVRTKRRPKRRRRSA